MLLETVLGRNQVELKTTIDLCRHQTVDGQRFGRLYREMLAGLCAAAEGQGDAEIALSLWLYLQHPCLNLAVDRKLPGLKTGQRGGCLAGNGAECEMLAAEGRKRQNLSGCQRLIALRLNIGQLSVGHLQLEQQVKQLGRLFGCQHLCLQLLSCRNVLWQRVEHTQTVKRFCCRVAVDRSNGRAGTTGWDLTGHTDGLRLTGSGWLAS